MRKSRKSAAPSNQNRRLNDCYPQGHEFGQFTMPTSHHSNFQYQNQHANLQTEHQTDKTYQHPQVHTGRNLNPVYAARQQVQKPMLLRAPILKIPQQILSNLSKNHEQNLGNFAKSNPNMNMNMAIKKESNFTFQKQNMSNFIQEDHSNMKLPELSQNISQFSRQQQIKAYEPIFNTNTSQFQNSFKTTHRQTYEKPSLVGLQGSIQAPSLQSKQGSNSQQKMVEIEKNNVKQTEKLIQNTFISQQKQTDNSKNNVMYMNSGSVNYDYSFHNKTIYVPLRKRQMQVSRVTRDSRAYRTNYKVKFTIDIICNKTLEQIEQVVGKFQAGFINPHLPQTMKEILEQIQIKTYDGIYLYQQIETNQLLGIVFVKGACVGTRVIGDWGWDQWGKKQFTQVKEQTEGQNIGQSEGQSEDKKRMMKCVRGLSMWGDNVAIRWARQMYVDECILEEASIKGHFIDLPEQLISSAIITFYNVSINQKDESALSKFFAKNCKNLGIDKMKGYFHDVILHLIVVYL